MKKGFIVGFLSGVALIILVEGMIEADIRRRVKELENTNRTQTLVPPGKIVL